VKKYERGDLPKSDWLDKMAFRKMEEIHAVREGFEAVLPSLPLLHRQKQKSQRICFCTSICPDSISQSYSVNPFVGFIPLSVIPTDNS